MKICKRNNEVGRAKNPKKCTKNQALNYQRPVEFLNENQNMNVESYSRTRGAFFVMVQVKSSFSTGFCNSGNLRCKLLKPCHSYVI